MDHPGPAHRLVGVALGLLLGGQHGALAGEGVAAGVVLRDRQAHRVLLLDPARVAVIDPDHAEHTRGELLSAAHRITNGLRGLSLELEPGQVHGLSSAGNPLLILETVRAIQGREVTGLHALYHAVEHFGMHTGQILYIAKLRRGESLGLYELVDGVPRERWRG